jgi:hypothetical protein
MPGRKPHAVRHPPRWRERLDQAVTPEERMGVAYQRLTAALARMRRTKRPDPLAQAQDTATANAMADDITGYLMQMAAQAEGGDAL